MPLIPNDQFETYAWILFVLVIGTTLKGTAVFIQEVLIGSVVELAVMALRRTVSGMRRNWTTKR